MDLQGSRRRGGRYRVVGIFPLLAERSGSGGRANQCGGSFQWLKSSAFHGALFQHHGSGESRIMNMLATKPASSKRGCVRLAAEYMKTTLRSGLVAAILIVASFGTTPQRIAASPSSPSSNLLGAWKLKSVGGKAPSTINIESWQIEFRERGKWTYSGAMTGAYEGMNVSGSGTWLLEGSELDYTAGANKGETTVHVDGGSLTLSPDPVVRLHGKEAVETRYVRPVSP
jgi:hypothetical protein